MKALIITAVVLVLVTAIVAVISLFVRNRRNAARRARGGAADGTPRAQAAPAATQAATAAAATSALARMLGRGIGSSIAKVILGIILFCVGAWLWERYKDYALTPHINSILVNASGNTHPERICGRVLLSTMKSIKVPVDSARGWKISYAPVTREGFRVNWEAWHNVEERVTKYTPQGESTTHFVTTHHGLTNMQFALSQEYDEAIPLVFMLHKGEAPADWFGMAVRATQ